ncbi:MAG: WxcM-like domain-containing protein [Rubrivivax sp.]|nr:WxcM-like domain-containing protein [Rubrivivax sp.]
MSALDTIHKQWALSPGPAPAALGARIDPLARVDPWVVVPDDVIIKSGAYVPAGVILEAGCFIGPNVAFVDPLPGSTTNTVVGKQAWIGANATIHPGITIAAKAVVRPGAVVTRSVPPSAIVDGAPAAIVGYVGVSASAPEAASVPATPVRAAIEPTAVAGVTVRHLPLVHDLRGDLTVGEFERHIPFVARRYFMVFGVPNREVRGEHAHIECHQFLVCARGDCAVIADDGLTKAEVLLNAPNKGLHLPPMTWGIQYKHSPDAVLLVFASHYYDSADYIREYGEFLERVGRKGTA